MEECGVGPRIRMNKFDSFYLRLVNVFMARKVRIEYENAYYTAADEDL